MKFVGRISILVFVMLLPVTALLAQDTGSVKGKVRTEDGDSIADVKIIARRDGKDLKSTTSDRKGEFRINGLRPGRYNLVFDKYGFSSGVLYDVLIKEKKVNNLRDRLYMTVDEGTLVIINGSVFNQNGHSIYGATVLIEEMDSGKPEKAGKLYSSRSGQFTFKFPEGKKKFRITASAKDVSAYKEIEVEEASVYRLAITLNIPEKTE